MSTEKIRIRIACLLQNDVNTLIFDEPTNHIDIFTREILEDKGMTVNEEKFKGVCFNVFSYLLQAKWFFSN